MIKFGQMLLTFTFLLAGHFIGDFAFQSSWMAEHKGKVWDVLIMHVATYTSAVFLMIVLMFVATNASLQTELVFKSIAWVFFSHLVVDAIAIVFGKKPSLTVDQLIHFVILIPAALILS